MDNFVTITIERLEHVLYDGTLVAGDSITLTDCLFSMRLEPDIDYDRTSAGTPKMKNETQNMVLELESAIADKETYEDLYDNFYSKQSTEELFRVTLDSTPYFRDTSTFLMSFFGTLEHPHGKDNTKIADAVLVRFSMIEYPFAELWDA